jgi:hypothetical protein
MADNLYILTSTSDYTTVGELINNEKSVASVYKNTPDYFLSIKGDDDLTNKQRVLNQFPAFKQKELENLSSANLPLPTGIPLYVEKQKVEEIIVTNGIEVVSTDTVAFKSAQLAALEADTGYVSVTPIQEGYIQNGGLKTAYPDVTVWVWCKGLTPGTDENELKGELFDLTPFIESVSTNIGKTGGNFQIALPPLVCELDNSDRWVIKRATLTQYQQSNEYVAQGDLYNDELSRNQFLFQNLITPNDLVFIRFETLHLEKEQRIQESRNYNIDKNLIAGRIYDMIGLVDTTSISINSQNNDVRIQIEGRDLSKLFIDDGTYFYALESTQGIIKVAGETRLKNSLLGRTVGDGTILFMNMFQFNTIEYIIQFVIQQLSNIKIVPDDLFTSYGVRVNKRFDVIQQQQLSDNTNKEVSKNTNYNYSPQIKEEKANGIWQIVKLVMDDEVKKRRLCDTSFSTACGSLMNFIHGTAQEPLVEFYGDTYGDQYHMIFRKPPYDQKSIISLIEGKVNTENKAVNVTPAIIDIEALDVLQERLAMDDSQVYSWYHFFPQIASLGSNTDVSLSYLPAVFFEEYAEVFGSKPFQQTHSYVPFDKNANIADFEKQAVEDLKYVIESSQYLPFSRKGTIVLNGDRRLKIGNIIRYKPTGEVFYIEHVTQQFQVTESGIERTTTIHVCRGLVEQLVYGVQYTNSEGSSKYVSYFNIIDTTLTEQYKDIPQTNIIRKKTGTKEVEVQDYSLDGIGNTFSNALNSVETFFGANGMDGVLIHPELNTGVFKLNRYTNKTAKNLFIKFINGVNAMGYKVYITDTTRTAEEQARLKLANTNNALPTTSKHVVNGGTAIDINIISIKTGKQLFKYSSTSEWLATLVPQYAKSIGLRWGGEIFKNYPDRVHFEIPTGKRTVIEDVYEEITEHTTIRVFDRDSVFSKFKVNKFSFNFFIKNLQFNPEYRIVKNRQVYNSDGSLPEIIIKSTNK